MVCDWEKFFPEPTAYHLTDEESWAVAQELWSQLFTYQGLLKQ